MPHVVVIDRNGDEHVVNGQSGHSVMEIIRDGGFDELLALCGGCCSCATCHVYVDPDFAGRLPAMSEDENELLESSSHRRPGSRLACQLPFSDALEGLRVEIVPDEWAL